MSFTFSLLGKDWPFFSALTSVLFCKHLWVRETGTIRTVISLSKEVLFCDLQVKSLRRYTWSSRWRQKVPLSSESHIDLSVCLQGSHKNFLKPIHYYQQGYLLFRKRILAALSNSCSTSHVSYCILGRSFLESLFIPYTKLSTTSYMISLNSRYTFSILLIIWYFIIF